MIPLTMHRIRPGLYVGPAFPGDGDAIMRLLTLAAQDCLPVSRDELKWRLGEFEVARSPSGRVVGCAAVRASGGQAELRCVIVHPAWRGTGVGRSLVERALQRASAAGEALFCVSRKPRFFEALGFSRLPDRFVPSRSGTGDSAARRHALIRWPKNKTRGFKLRPCDGSKLGAPALSVVGPAILERAWVS